MKRRSLGLGYLGFAFAGPAFGHHGSYEYDLSVTEEYEGVIVEHIWKNPHTLTVLETRSESGEPLRLEIEGGGPSGLRTLGVTVSSIAVGDRVTAIVSPSRRFPNRSAFGLRIVKEDGTVVPLGGRGAHVAAVPTAATASDIFGTWAGSREEFTRMVNSRTSWSFTEKGRNAFETYNPTMSSQAQCVPVAAPWLMVHPVVNQIERLADRIVLRTDWMGAERIVYLDGRGHPPVEESFQQGHSIGRWEDDVLVVDSTNFTERIYAGLASSSGKHLVERLSLSADGQNLNYAFVLEDPEYLAAPVSGTYRWTYRPNLTPSDVECDPELAKRYIREFR